MPGAFNPLTRHGNEHEGTRFSPATGTVSAVLFSTPPSQIDDTRVEDFEDATDRTSPSVVHIDEAQTRLMSSQGQDIGQGGESDDTDDIGEFDNIDDQDAEAGVEVVNVMLLTDGNDELPHSAPDTTKFPLTPTGSRDGPGRLPMTQTDIAGNVKPPRGEKVDSEPRISSLNASKHIDQSPLGVYNDRCPRMSGSDPEINQTLMQPYDDSGTYTPQSDSSVISTHDHTQAEVDQSQMRADVDGSSEIDGCSLLLVEDQQGEGRVDDAGGSQAQSNRGPSDLPEVAQIHVSSSDLSSSDLSSSDDSNRDGGPQLATDLDDPQSGSESSDNDNSGIAPLNHRNDDRQTGAPSDINNSDNLISDNHDIGPSSRFKMPLRIASLDPFPSFADSDEISPLIFRDESIHRDSTTDDRSPSDYTRSPGRVSFISHSGRTLFPSGCEGAHFRTRSARGKQKIECFDSGFAETISLLEERRSVEVGTQTDGTHISSAYVKGLERQILELKKDRSRLQAQVRKLEAAQRRPFFLRSWFGRSSAMPSRSQSPVRSQGVSTDSDIRGVKLR
jgi:hypothetical protein